MLTNSLLEINFEWERDRMNFIVGKNADGCEACRGKCCHQWLREQSVTDWRNKVKIFQVERARQSSGRFCCSVVESRRTQKRSLSSTSSVLQQRAFCSGGRHREEKRLSVRVERSWSPRFQESGRHVLLRPAAVELSGRLPVRPQKFNMQNSQVSRVLFFEHQVIFLSAK